MPKKKSFIEILNKIKASKNILLLTHRAPDGDGIGAMLALYHFLKKKRKNLYLFSSTPPKYLNFLKDYEKIQKKLNTRKKFDLIIALDYADDKRIDTPREVELCEENFISIDHHLNGKLFGKINFIDPKASSVCEIIYDFLKFAKAKITKEIANDLLVGIFTDTVGFSRVLSKKTKKIIIELLKEGGEIEKIVSSYYQISFSQAKLLERFLSRIRQEKEIGLVYSWLSYSDFSQIKKEKGETELFLQEPPIFPDFLAKIGQADVYLFLIKLKKDKIKASLRASSGKINVAKIAEKRGGGGHKEAAGFFMRGEMKEAIDFVKEEILKLKRRGK